jgi:predicted ATPase
MDPLVYEQDSKRAVRTHPTALPRKNIQIQSMGKLGEKLAPIPKTAVRKRVALNGNDRPRISETVPQPTAPIII